MPVAEENLKTEKLPTPAGKAKQRQRLKANPSAVRLICEGNRCEPALVRQDPKASWGKEGGRIPTKRLQPQGRAASPLQQAVVLENEASEPVRGAEWERAGEGLGQEASWGGRADYHQQY